LLVKRGEMDMAEPTGLEKLYGKDKAEKKK
jgi:hypothetical protein